MGACASGGASTSTMANVWELRLGLRVRDFDNRYSNTLHPLLGNTPNECNHVFFFQKILPSRSKVIE